MITPCAPGCLSTSTPFLFFKDRYYIPLSSISAPHHRAAVRRLLTFAGVAVVTEVVALATVALVGAIDVGTLLTAGVVEALVNVWVGKSMW